MKQFLQWYKSLRVGDVLEFPMGDVYTVLARNRTHIELRCDSRNDPYRIIRQRKEFEKVIHWDQKKGGTPVTRMCRCCKRPKAQHARTGKCLFGPKHWD